jgi:chromosome segregation ATPase
VRRSFSVDDTRLELLEERIRKAAALIRSLREQSESLRESVEARESEIEELRERLAESPGDETFAELERLRSEREEIRSRVDRMIALLDEEESPAERDLLAAVDGAE